MARRGSDTIEAEVAGLTSLSRDELNALWQKAYQFPPPTGARRELLIRAAAWQLQARRLGGYPAETRRLLKNAMVEARGKLAMRVEAIAGQDLLTSAGGVDDSVHESDPAGTYSSPSARAVRRGNASSQLECKPAERSGRGPVPGSSKVLPRKLMPGARLLRDWNGKTHVVEVIDTGFVFESRHYKSLTAIALQITGAHWSGPRFFGIRSR